MGSLFNNAWLGVLAISVLLLPVPLHFNGVPEARHAVFVSVCTVTQPEAAQALKLRIRIFSNDLEDALRKFFNKENINLNQVHDNAEARQQVFTYLKQHLRLKVNGQEKAFTFDEIETEGDSYLRTTETILLAQNVSSVKSISLTNTILTTFLDGQTNIVRFKINGSRKVYNLDKKHVTAAVSF